MRTRVYMLGPGNAFEFVKQPDMPIPLGDGRCATLNNGLQAMVGVSYAPHGNQWDTC